MEEKVSLDSIGVKNTLNIFHNVPVARLIGDALCKNEGLLAANGALIVRTGERTGRSPNDKYFVKKGEAAEQIWWGDVNVPIDEKHFNRAYRKAKAFLQQRDLYVFDGYAGADKNHRLAVRVVTPLAWQALFANTLFIRPSAEELENHEPEFTILCASDLKLEPKEEKTVSEVMVATDMDRKLVLIAGSGYAGEIKKSIFTVMNYLLPQKKIMTMHCSANVGQMGDVALFFGLSGTGKTTLSADTARRLIGDDEHGWSDEGIFNFEGGCYAKCIRLSAEDEPQIYNAIHFGSVLENVIYDPVTHEVDYDDEAITENTRATYPIEHIPNAICEGTGGHPSDIFFLAADAFGVLPPIAKLDEAHAMYHFLSGYTAKLAGTEAGVTEPTATFSACFGQPFMPLHPGRYAELLGEKIREHGVRVWLVNTGWTGGAYGEGRRMSIKHTRALLRAALAGGLDSVGYHEDPIFGILIPDNLEGIPTEILNPRETWNDKTAYDKKAKYLAGLFHENFKKFESGVSEAVRNAAPKI